MTGSTSESSQKRPQRAEGATDWKMVETRKAKTTGEKPKANETKTQTEKGRTAPKHRGTAVLVRPLEDDTYSNIVRKIRSTVDPMKNKVKVTTIKKTRNGLCLKGIHTDIDGRENFRYALQNAIGGASNVRTITPKIQLEIMNLDCITTKADIKNALR